MAAAPAWVPVAVTIGAFAAATVSSVADEAWDQASAALRAHDLDAFDLRGLGGAAARPAKTVYKVVRYPFRFKVRRRQRRWGSVTMWRQTEEGRALDAYLGAVAERQPLLLTA